MFLYFRLILQALSLSCFHFRLLVNSLHNVEYIAKLFSINVVQPGPYWTRSAASSERCWNDPDGILLKYFPPSILHRIEYGYKIFCDVGYFILH